MDFLIYFYLFIYLFIFFATFLKDTVFVTQASPEDIHMLPRDKKNQNCVST
jgi:hypothetical protein